MMKRGEEQLKETAHINAVSLYVADIKRGVAFLSPPVDQPWGMRSITFFDPDGHRYEIARKIK